MTRLSLSCLSLSCLVVFGSGCVDGLGTRPLGLEDPPGTVVCDLDESLLVASTGPDAIPAITGPRVVESDDSEASYLDDTDRVLGITINGVARAYPHNILWHHEIVNDEVDGFPVSVTFCPLTGSGIAFRPTIDGRELDLGVSGLLFANNLVLYDRRSSDVYGPQLAVEGLCQAFAGSSLDLVPVQEMSWGKWKALHPETTVLSSEQGFTRNYRFYPYGGYDVVGNGELLVPMPVDQTRPIKERVLAIREGDGGLGYPFGELAALGDRVALNHVVEGVPTVVFYEYADGEAALAFDARVDGQTLTFEAGQPGSWTDTQTGSTWDFGGVATQGPLAGRRLVTRRDAYTLFWFAWKHFQPSGQLFSASTSSMTSSR